MDNLISRLSEIRSRYNCFDESEEPYYRALSEAIKLLSGQADGDTISRKAATNALCDNCETVNSSCAHYPCKRYLAIEQLPSKQRWIPVTERLPEFETQTRYDKSTYYLVTAQGFLWLARYLKCGDGTGSWDEDEGFIKSRDVTAWMPLPEPYGERRTE